MSPSRSVRRRSRPLLLLLAAVLLGLAASAGPASAASAGFARAFALTHGAAPPARAQPRIVGGTVLTSTSSAPYTVAIQTSYPATGKVGGCSGTILDPVHILTAAHCVVSGDLRAAPANVVVAAGSSDLISPVGRAQASVVRVARIRVHPLYRYPSDRDDKSSYADDVAVLTLAVPLNLAGPTIQPLPMAPVGVYVGAANRIRVTGFGVTAADADDFGTMRSVHTEVVTAGQCGVDAPAAMLCTFRRGHAACEGGSGGTAAVKAVSRSPSAAPRATGTRYLVGVTNIAARDCAAGLNLYANVTAPEVRVFVDAAVAEHDLTAAQIPVSPRGGRTIRISGRLRVGRTIRCRRGAWSGSPRFRYAFFKIKGHRERETKPSRKSRYRLRSSDRGWRIGCAVLAANPGGTGVSLTRKVRTVR